MAQDRDLVDLLTQHKLAMDNAYPDVGMGLFPSVARQEAIEELKAQGKIAADYKETK